MTRHGRWNWPIRAGRMARARIAFLPGRLLPDQPLPVHGSRACLPERATESFSASSSSLTSSKGSLSAAAISAAYCFSQAPNGFGFEFEVRINRRLSGSALPWRCWVRIHAGWVWREFFTRRHDRYFRWDAGCVSVSTPASSLPRPRHALPARATAVRHAERCSSAGSTRGFAVRELQSLLADCVRARWPAGWRTISRGASPASSINMLSVTRDSQSGRASSQDGDSVQTSNSPDHFRGASVWLTASMADCKSHPARVIFAS